MNFFASVSKFSSGEPMSETQHTAWLTIRQYLWSANIAYTFSIFRVNIFLKGRLGVVIERI